MWWIGTNLIRIWILPKSKNGIKRNPPKNTQKIIIYLIKIYSKRAKTHSNNKIFDNNFQFKPGFRSKAVVPLFIRIRPNKPDPNGSGSTTLNYAGWVSRCVVGGGPIPCVVLCETIRHGLIGLSLSHNKCFKVMYTLLRKNQLKLVTSYIFSSLQ